MFDHSNYRLFDNYVVYIEPGKLYSNKILYMVFNILYLHKFHTHFYPAFVL